MIKAETTSTKQLREYGFVMGAAVAVIFSLYPWLILKKTFVIWPWGVVAGFWSLSILCPKVLAPFYLLWMKVGHVLGKINSTLLLSVCFFVLFVPVAIFFRLRKRDRLHRRNKNAQTSFRQMREYPRQVKQMELPF